MNTFGNLLAAALFYIIPTVVGSALLLLKALPKKSRRKRPPFHIQIALWARAFVYGALFLYLVAIIIDFLTSNGSLSSSFVQAFAAAVKVLFFLALAINITSVIYFAIRDKKVNFDFSSILIFLLLAELAVIVYTIWRWDSPFFTTLNWDIYHHQTIVNSFLSGNFSFVTAKVTDSFQFNGYSTLFHTLLTIPQAVVNTDILHFWWHLEAFHLFTTILVSYSLGVIVSKSKWVGMISAIFGAFVFESAVSYTSLFLIPQNLVATAMVVLFAYYVLRNSEKKEGIKRLLSMDLVVFILYTILNHYVIGTMGIALIIFTVLYLILTNKFPKLEAIALIGSFALLIIVPILASFVDLNALNRGEAAFFNFNVAKKFELMKDFYGYGMFVFLPIGYIYALTKKQRIYNLVIIIVNSLLAVIIASIPYSLKFYSIERYFVHVLMALGVWAIIRSFKTIDRIVALVVLVVCMALIITINIDTYKQVPKYKEISTHITQNELEASNFLRDNHAHKPVLLISDPATMHILEGVSGINTPGGAYTSITTREILTDIYFTRDETITDKLFIIDDGLQNEKHETVLFAVSGRLIAWELASTSDKLGIHWNIWEPHDLSIRQREDYDFIFYLRDILGYKEVFSNDGMVIFEVERGHIPPELEKELVDAPETTESTESSPL